MGRDEAGISAGRGAGGALLAQRTRFHLAYRLALRAWQTLDAAGGRSPGFMRTLPVGVALDVASWWLLRTSDRLWSGPRFAFDAADDALWRALAPSASMWVYTPDGYMDIGTLAGVPLATEAGVRFGLAGLAVPAAHLAVHAAVFGRRRRVHAGEFKWQALGVLGGVATVAYERRVRASVSTRLAEERAAKTRRAFLAGQNDVAMGADSVVDLLARTAPLVASGDATAATARALGAWKASLAERIGGEATYLGEALRRWELAHNQQPDLAADVEFVLTDGDGTTLLTAGQAEELDRKLAGLGLRGRVAVSVAGSAMERPPGQRLELTVGGRRLRVGADRTVKLAPFDPLPAALVMGGVWALGSSLPSLEGAPLWAMAPCALGAAVLAVHGHLDLRRRGRAARRRLIFGAFAVDAAHGLVATATMRNPFTPTGTQRVPIAGSFNTTAVAVALGGEELSPLDRLLLGGGVAACGLVGLSVARGKVGWRDVLAALPFPLIAFSVTRGLREALDDDARALSDEAAGTERAVVERAYEDGRHSVVALARQARDDTARVLDERGEELEPELRAVVAARLEEVDRRLAALSAPRVPQGPDRAAASGAVEKSRIRARRRRPMSVAARRGAR